MREVTVNCLCIETMGFQYHIRFQGTPTTELVKKVLLAEYTKVGQTPSGHNIPAAIYRLIGDVYSKLRDTENLEFNIYGLDVDVFLTTETCFIPDLFTVNIGSILNLTIEGVPTKESIHQALDATLNGNDLHLMLRKLVNNGYYTVTHI